jgi:hypothetical protein
MRISFRAQRWLAPTSRKRTVALVAVLGIFALSVTAGAALDLLQAHLVKVRLQETVDAAALQGKGGPTRTDYGASATFSTVFLRTFGINSLTVSVHAPSSALLAALTHE